MLSPWSYLLEPMWGFGEKQYKRKQEIKFGKKLLIGSFISYFVWKKYKKKFEQIEEGKLVTIVIISMATFITKKYYILLLIIKEKYPLKGCRDRDRGEVSIASPIHALQNYAVIIILPLLKPFFHMNLKRMRHPSLNKKAVTWPLCGSVS